ncbi:MAG: efflux RND transporter permease subunit [Desulfovibrionaceae bacterium]|nr:efflux RND transporter permease subunit [Desulfovibrionaceae bacterium]
MNISAPFISRPVGTTLLTLAIALVGIVAYALLPVSPLPQVDFATIRVSASLPGASPETMAATVATPLERTLGRIAGISEMTSTSSQGSTSIVLQFELDRDIDGAARDVQAAINAARAILPTMPRNPSYWKMNPSDSPIMVIGLTSDAMTKAGLYDIASTVFKQKLSQVYGVGEVSVGGGALPAVRVEINPGFLQSRDISLEDARAAIAGANVNMPKGILDDGETQWFVGANDQLRTAEDFAPIIIRHHNGATLRLSDVADVDDSVEDVRNVGYVNGKPAVLLIIYKQPGANIIETVRRVRSALPTLRSWMPESVDFTIVMDRSPSIAASVREVENALLISMFLVVLVVYLFLRNGRATFIPAVAVPVSLLGTFGVMYLFGYSLNHLSLMALTVATGFVVDDAIVVTENIVRHMEDGVPPVRAAYLGSREVAFTVMSISFSLIAVFIPILGMGGILGRLFKEFAVTLSAAVLVSLVVSLVVTPMMCAQLLRPEAGPLPPEPEKARFPTFMGRAVRSVSRGASRLIRLWGDFMDWLHESYARTLAVVLRHKFLTLLTLLLTIGCNIYLYVIVPKGFFPQQDVGQIFGMIRADQSISFQAMQPKLEALMDIVSKHPGVNAVGGFTGGAQRNSGMVFINLKPARERKQSMEQVINELREQLAVVPGGELFLNPMQDLRMGGRRTRAAYQYTLQSDDLALLRQWTPRITQAFQDIPGMADVNSDQETRGLQTMVTVDRDVIARLGVTQKQVDTALGLAFGQSLASTIYTGGNQYRVVMEFAPEYLQGPEGLFYLYVPSGGSTVAVPAFMSTGISGNTASTSAASGAGAAAGEHPLVPLSAFSSFEPTLTALSVSHQSQFTASTISFNLLPGVALSDVQEQIEATMLRLGVPETVRGSFQGTAGAFARSMSDQPLLILAAVVTLYIVLGVLYESLIHPLTILSTLPSAGMGAILGLMLFGAEFTVIAFIGVLLLAGIVKKNAIMMIDFAVEARRSEGLSALDAIYKACLLRFRPIMMTTMAAVGGAVPLMLGSGDGAEIRTPLGITIVGGLLVSQLLTLYTTPVVYLYLDRFSRENKTAERARLRDRQQQDSWRGSAPILQELTLQ